MRVLHDALRPPDGHELECAIGCTFTLDLVSLLSIPLAVGRFAAVDGGPHEADPLELLASIERCADKITVFHQAGLIRAPDRHRELLTLVEGSLVGVALPRASLFHPKVWVVRYAAGGSKEHHRVVVLSRNLVPDRCWDTMVVLEGRTTRRTVSESGPLRDFLRWLSRRPGLSDDRRSKIEALARSVANARFEAPRPFETVRFRPLRLSGREAHPVADARRDRVLVVSPFVGERELHRLSRGSSGSILVTRSEELARLADPSATGFETLNQLDDGLEPEPEGDPADPSGTALYGLHAKLYVADQGWNATAWTGSANATSAGFGTNVEFLVELAGKKSVCGVDAVLGNATVRGTFASMLCPLDATAAQPTDDDLERRLDAAAASVAALPLEVVCGPFENAWRLELRVTQPAKLPADALVRLAPLASTLTPKAPDLSAVPVVEFAGLAEHEVSGLFLVELRLQQGAERTFVAHWPVVGELPDRVRALLRRLVTDCDGLIAFLKLLLGGADGAGLGIAPATAAGRNGSRWGAAFGSAPPLELLLGTLAKDPERLDALAKWVPELAAAAGGAIERELLEIWTPIWQARQELSA